MHYVSDYLKLVGYYKLPAGVWVTCECGKGADYYKQGTSDDYYLCEDCAEEVAEDISDRL